LSTGDTVIIANHAVNTAANGSWKIVKVDGTSFTLTGSTGNGIGGATGTLSIAPFTWVWPAPLLSPFAVQPYTLEYGYGSSGARFTSVIFHKLNIKMEMSKQWEVTLGGWYHTYTEGWTMTGGLLSRSVEPILTPGTVMYLEAANGVPGTTAFADTLLSAELDYDSKVNPLYTTDSKHPSLFGYDKTEAKLKLKCIYTSALQTWIATNLYGGSRGVVELKQTNGGAKQALVKFAGIQTEDIELYQDEKGTQVVEINLEGETDAGTLANYLEIDVTNNLSLIP
jgi:hypothetical protein